MSVACWRRILWKKGPGPRWLLILVVFPGGQLSRQSGDPHRSPKFACGGTGVVYQFLGAMP